MNFEQTLRDRISKAPFRSKEKDLLKLVLGTYQQKAAGGKITDEQGVSIVKSMIGTNNEMLFGNAEKHPPVKPIFATDDPRRLPIMEETKLLSTLLPTYLTADQIEASLTTAGLVEQIKTVKEGQAMGIAIGHFKTNDVKVEGDTVKTVVRKLRT